MDVKHPAQRSSMASLQGSPLNQSSPYWSQPAPELIFYHTILFYGNRHSTQTVPTETSSVIKNI